jgi:outer membrane lipoprotein-sorting protein
MDETLRQRKEGKMDKKIRLRLVIVLGIFISLIVFSSMALAAEFSADLIIDNPEGKFTGKVYVKGDKIRQEFLKEDEKQVMILRLDKGVTWTLMPMAKMYMEIPGIGKEAADPEIEKKIKDMAEKKSLGKEKVSGYVCEKYQYIYHDKSLGILTQWLSKRLNYPIKTEYKAAAYHMLTEYKNIKEEGIPNSLFEIPSGYQKMQLPMMPGNFRDAN